MTDASRYGKGDDPPAMSDVARDVYLEFLCREASGESADFEAYCQRAPELASQLRHLRREDSRTASEEAHGTSSPHGGATHATARVSHVNAADVLRLLQRVARSPERARRYRRQHELGHGAMGRVYRAWDDELARELALKVLDPSAADGTPRSATDRLLRFVHEAQLTSQLDHPGIVPVHDLGMDESDRPFFAMKLVDGIELKHVFRSAWLGEEDWSRTRVVGVLVKICDAMSYAHSKGVVHRDLKPTNVMIGRFGEVFVMDWGVAHVLRRDDRESAVRTASDDASPAPAELDGGSITREGAILGTAAYMPPEQARGDARLLGAWTDVYAVGALLYHLLARRPPYASYAPSGSTVDVLARLRAGPPEPLARTAPDAPPELASICERAMARDPMHRYPDMKALGDDLRAYLEGRVVRAHRTGVRAEVKKWLRRNRAFAIATSCGVFVTLMAGLAALRWQSDGSRLALLKELREPSQLLEQFEFLWPASAERLRGIEAWLAATERVLERAAEYRSHLHEMRARAEPWDRNAPLERRAREYTENRLERLEKTLAHYESARAMLARTGGTTQTGETLADVEAELEIFRARMPELLRDRDAVPRASWSFSTAGDELMHERLSRIDRELVQLEGGPDEPPRVEIARRIVNALVEQQTHRPTLDDVWDEAVDSIASVAACPQYSGLRLERHEHLIPLGQDGASGLWEFAHALTGSVPPRDADGRLRLDGSSAVVLVLIPAGTVLLGSQRIDRGSPNHDPDHQRIEQPLVSLPLDAFFLSKFELTQAQWARLSGDAAKAASLAHDATEPAHWMSWERATWILETVGLTLPSEAQWEYATRAGTDTPWWTGSTDSTVVPAANLWEATPNEDWSERYGQRDVRSAGADGWLSLAPVGSLAANAFGLHDVIGNVAELCRDRGVTTYGYRNSMIGTGERLRSVDHLRVARGGSCGSDPRDARSAARTLMSRDERARFVGLRPSLDIDP